MRKNTQKYSEERTVAMKYQRYLFINNHTVIEKTLNEQTEKDHKKNLKPLILIY